MGKRRATGKDADGILRNMLIPPTPRMFGRLAARADPRRASSGVNAQVKSAVGGQTAAGELIDLCDRFNA